MVQFKSVCQFFIGSFTKSVDISKKIQKELNFKSCAASKIWVKTFLPAKFAAGSSLLSLLSSAQSVHGKTSIFICKKQRSVWLVHKFECNILILFAVRSPSVLSSSPTSVYSANTDGNINFYGSTMSSPMSCNMSPSSTISSNDSNSNSSSSAYNFQHLQISSNTIGKIFPRHFYAVWHLQQFHFFPIL